MMQMLPKNDYQTIKAVFMEESNIVVNDFQYFLKHFNILESQRRARGQGFTFNFYPYPTLASSSQFEF